VYTWVAPTHLALRTHPTHLTSLNDSTDSPGSPRI